MSEARIIVAPHDQLTEAEQAAVDAIERQAFADESPSAFEWDGGDETVLLSDDTDRAVSTAAILWRSATLADREIVAGGIGGVATAPDAQGRGFASVTLQAAEAALTSRPVDLLVLFCQPALRPFYEARGWVESPWRTWVVRGGESVVFDEQLTMVKAPQAIEASGDLVIANSPW
jgi:GNAT superfamily N-acetyltransferase